MNSIADLSVIPDEMVFASASGLDPHISPEAALMQVERICTARHFNNDQKEELFKNLKDLTEAPQFNYLGEKRVNVLLLNMELDKIDEN
jgi:K+-transporting ATPase ATPase C chain